MRVLKDIPYPTKEGLYDPENARQMDLYLPDIIQPNLPFVFFVHGGAWISNNKSAFRFMGEAMAERGLIACVAGYRLTVKTKDNKIAFPDHYVDVADGFMAAIDQVARQTGIPKDRVKCVMAGHSAGAHLNGIIALQKDWIPEESRSKISTMVGIEGIYDLELLEKSFPTYTDWFLGWAFPNRSDWPKLSLTKTSLVSKIPQYIVYSLQDELVDDKQGLEFKLHLESVGCPVEYDTSVGGTHDLMLREPALFDILKKICYRFV